MAGRRSPLPWLAAALLAGTLAGCGNVARVPTGGTLQIALNEYRLTPQDVHVAAGTLTIEVRNDGRLTHDLVITHQGRTEAQSQPVAPGQTTELVASLAPGQYVMASSILNDQALGEYGTLHVR